MYISYTDCYCNLASTTITTRSVTGAGGLRESYNTKQMHARKYKI